MQPVTYDAIVLAGGRALRSGGRKLALRRDGRTLLEHAVTAVAGAQRVVLVGPTTELETDVPVRWRREDPPFGGPVAAVRAGLVDVTSRWVVVLAGDLPDAGPAVAALLAAVSDDVDVAVLLDRDGVAQPLLAVYEASWLRSRAAAGATAARSLLDGARTAPVTDTWGAANDIDTPGQASERGFAPG